MKKVVFKVYILSIVFFYSLNAQNSEPQNIVDIVDYRFDSIRNNINGDIDKIKAELKKIKELQNKTIENEILNIDKSIKNFEQSIADSKAFEKEYQDEVQKYNEVVIRQDKKLQSINSDLNTWGLMFLLVGFFTAVISFLFIRIFTRKAKENAAKEVNEILDRWIRKKEIHEEAQEEKNELKDQIEYWQNRYEELQSDDKKLFEEFKVWSKSIKDKEIKNRIKKYIKKFQKENKLKEDS